MKIQISETQLKAMLDKVVTSQDIDEQDVASGDTTSSAYPEVGKWESGATKGVANPSGEIKKWSDTEGTQPVRGKANPLK
jgi:hypothetical protein